MNQPLPAPQQDIFIRNLNSRHILDRFFVAAVSTVLLTRTFLYLTGFPSIATNSLHVAHMLWGGVFMLAAMITLLGFLGRRSQQFAAIMGGIGFGLFIDEIGKFLTRDNNYFFQPTITIIYLIFVVIYFLIREIDKTRSPDTKTRIINSLSLLSELAIADFDKLEQEKVLRLMRDVPTDNPFYKKLLLLAQHGPIVEEAPGRWHNLKSSVFNQYKNIFHAPAFKWLIWSVTIAQSGLAFLIIDQNNFGGIPTFIQLAFLIFSGAGVLYALFGLFMLARNRLAAYRILYRALLIYIFLAQPFAFYFSILIPTITLLLSLLCLSAVSLLIQLETSRSQIVAVDPEA